MARTLRSLGTLARLALQEAEASGLQQQQQRFMSRYSPKQYSKDAPMDKSGTWIPKNPHIEAWYYRRDRFEREFSWSSRNTFEIAYYLMGVSVGIFYLSKWMMRHNDSRAGYPSREVLFDHTGTGFVSPDEREFY